MTHKNPIQLRTMTTKSKSCRTQNSILAAALIAATGSSVSADVFNWIGSDGDWSNSNLWFGPMGQIPDSILDSATVSGQFNQITLDINISLGALNVLGGADLYATTHSIFVNGNTIVDGSSSALIIQDSPALRDLDTDTLTLRNGAFYVQGSGSTQFDEAVLIQSNSAFIASGVVEMNSTTGDFVIESGALWLQEQFNGQDSLIIQRTQSSNSSLDWTHPGSGVLVWNNKLLDLRIPFSGALGGSLSVSSGGVFKASTPFITGGASEVSLTGGPDSGDGTSTIMAPNAIDIYGELNLSGFAEIETPLLALRGFGSARDTTVMKFDTTFTLFDSFVMIPNEVDGGSFEFGVNSTTLSVVNGVSGINTGVGGTFDLDGLGAMEVNISEDASLILDVQYIERGAFNQFDSTLNIEGMLDVLEVVFNESWINAGEINLEGGEIHGRRLIHNGTITGTGHITAITINNGTIIADGGTLQIDEIDLDGSNPNQEGVIRAQTGDFIFSDQSPAPQFFSGSIFVGNGVGVREVFECNAEMSIANQNMAEGLIDMNSGRFRANTINLYAQLIAQGVSQLNASGNQPSDRINFGNSSTSTIAGILELTGDVQIESDASFQGEGTLQGINVNNTMNLFDGVSLNDVSLETVGSVSVDDGVNGVGHVSVASLTLAPSSTLIMDLAGSNNSVEQDHINVLEEVELDGMLKVGVVEGFSVKTDQVYTIINANSITGEFSGLDYSGLGEGYRATVVIYPDRVDVVVNCHVDLNGDGELDFFDISAFLLAHELNEKIADFNNDAQYDFFDISLFLSLFSMGCP